MRQILFFTFILMILSSLTACNTQPDTPESVSQQFWSAVQQRDMEKAKEFASWDTVDYLKYLNTDKLSPQRFELGESMQGDSRAEIATTLYTQKQGTSGVKVPGVTVLFKTEHGWRVNVKKTMTSVVRHTANNVFDQLNGLLQEGIEGLDQQLSESMNELGKALEEGAIELKKELSKPLFEPNDNPINNPPRFKDPFANPGERQKI